MAHVDLIVSWVRDDLIVGRCLLDQDLTYENLDSLVAEEVLEELLLVLRLQKGDWNSVQLPYGNIVCFDPRAFDIGKHRERFPLFQLSLEEIQMFHEQAEKGVTLFVHDGALSQLVLHSSRREPVLTLLTLDYLSLLELLPLELVLERRYQVVLP